MIMHGLHSVHHARLREVAQRVEKVVIIQSPPISGAPKPEMELSSGRLFLVRWHRYRRYGQHMVRPGRFQLS
jgi:hypothetical protein